MEKTMIEKELRAKLQKAESKNRLLISGINRIALGCNGYVYEKIMKFL